MIYLNWRELNKEADFVLRDGNGIRSLIQVTNEITPENYQREISSLLKESQELACRDLKIITWDEETDLDVKNKKIKVIPLWRWFVAENLHL